MWPTHGEHSPPKGPSAALANSPGQRTVGRYWTAAGASPPGTDSVSSPPVQPPSDSQTRRPASVRAAGSRSPAGKGSSGRRQGQVPPPSRHKLQLSEASLSVLTRPPPPGSLPLSTRPIPAPGPALSWVFSSSGAGALCSPGLGASHSQGWLLSHPPAPAPSSAMGPREVT